MKFLTLNQTHPDYQKDLLERLEGLYCGGEEWREKIATWIPKNTAEPEDLWAERKKRAVYHNHAGPIVDLIVAYLFAEAVNVAGLDPVFLRNVDRRGTDWTPFWRKIFTDALIYQRAYVWVNLPARNSEVQPKSRAEEEQLGLLNTYLVGLEAEEVIDWGEDDAGALAWVMIRQHFQHRGGPEESRKKGIRWIYVDAARIRIWEWYATPDKSTPDPEETIQEKASFDHNIGRLPVVAICLPDGLWAMGKLHDPAVALLRASNDLDWALHRAAHALMTVTTKDGFVTPKVGAGYYINLSRDSDGEDKVSFAEPSGATFEALDKRIKDLREELYRIVQALALAVSPGSTKQQSGESKAKDWQAMEVILSAYAGIILEAMRQVGIVVAGIRRQAPPEVSGLDGWQQEDLTELLNQIVLVLGLSIPSPTLKRVLQKKAAARLLVDASPEERAKIDKEIEEAPEEPDPYQPPADSSAESTRK